MDMRNLIYTKLPMPTPNPPSSVGHPEASTATQAALTMFLCLGHWGRGCGLEAHLPATALRGRLQIKLARVQQEMQVRL